MNSNNREKTLLLEYLEKHPFLKEIGQLHMEAAAISSQIAVEKFSLPSFADYTEDFNKGIPLLQHAEIQAALGKPVEHMMHQLLESLLKADIPKALKDSCHALEKYLSDNAATEMIGYVLCQEEESIQIFCEKKELNASTLRYIVWLAVSNVMQSIEDERKEWQKDLAWERNYCPVCGSLPVLAQLKKKNQGRERHLVCSHCHETWHYKRIGCIYCDNDDLNKLRLLETAAEPEMRIDVCKECHSYSKTYLNEGKEPVYLNDWATVHLDMLAEEKGLKRKGLFLI